MAWMVAVLTWDADKKNSRGDSLREALTSTFSVYCPKVRDLIAANGRRVWRSEWLFGRYAFVEKLVDWRGVFRHRAVQDVLPGSALDDEINRFRDMEDADGFVVLPEDAKRRALRRGDACRIVEGPFSECVAVYHGMGRRDRELALISYMGRQVRVEVAAGALVPA